MHNQVSEELKTEALANRFASVLTSGGDTTSGVGKNEISAALQALLQHGTLLFEEKRLWEDKEDY